MKKILCFSLVLFYYLTTSAQIIFGANNYTEYHEGTLPIIISVPHGGSLTPSSIPDRSCNNPTLVTDSYTILLAKQIDSSLYNLTGRHAHLIICNLKRTKIDCNREIIEGACGNSEAVTAWTQFHNFITTAEGLAQSVYPQKAFYIDLHGHGHTIQQLELGYLYNAAQLAYSDTELNSPSNSTLSSIKNLVVSNVNGYTNAQMLRGNFALGTLIANAGFPAVPSLQTPSPGSNPYFDGGYNTANYTCHAVGNATNGVQIECNSTVRSTYASRKAFADSLASVLINYFQVHENLNLLPCTIATPVVTAASATTFCQGNSVQLSSSPAASYQWSTGETTQSINVATSGNYTVRVSNGNCTATSAPQSITVNPLPTAPLITAGSTPNLCPGGNVILTGNTSGGIWSIGGSTSLSLTATVAGDYFVTTSNACGNTVSNHIVVSVSCNSPLNINAMVTGTTKATINWTGSACAYAYQLQYRKLGNTAWTTKSVLAPATSKLLTGLKAGSIYEYRVRTVCNASYSINSAYTEIQTFFTAVARNVDEFTTKNDQLDLKITPNPVYAKLSLTFKSIDATVKISVINLLGQIVISKQLYSSDGNFSEELNVSELNNGLYILFLETSNHAQQKKFIKQ